MKFFQETTKWSTNDTPNHIYLFSDDKSKAFGYVKAGTKDVIKFKSPIRFDLRGRTFKTVPNTFGYALEREVSTNPQWTVKGSKGDVYVVERTQNGLTCTCSGFKFRAKCKHVDSAPI